MKANLMPTKPMQTKLEDNNARIQTLEAALVAAKQVLETAGRYFPKSVRHADKFSLLNVLANSVNPALEKSSMKPERALKKKSI